MVTLVLVTRKGRWEERMEGGENMGEPGVPAQFPSRKQPPQCWEATAGNLVLTT